MRFLYWLRRQWRILWGNCIRCGQRVAAFQVVGQVGNDLYRNHPNPLCCRGCNKHAMHGSNYGMSGTRLQETINRG